MQIEMQDYINTIKALEATVARFQKQHVDIYNILYSRGIRCKNLASGLRRYLKRVEKARKLLK